MRKNRKRNNNDTQKNLKKHVLSPAKHKVFSNCIMKTLNPNPCYVNSGKRNLQNTLILVFFLSFWGGVGKTRILL